MNNFVGFFWAVLEFHPPDARNKSHTFSKTRCSFTPHMEGLVARSEEKMNGFLYFWRPAHLPRYIWEEWISWVHPGANTNLNTIF
jgi:hypothetical protein